MMRKTLFTIFSLTSFLTCAQNDTLTKKTQTFDDITIRSQKPKEIAFEDEKYYIIDFIVNNKGRLLLLKNLRSYFVYSLDDNFATLYKLRLNFKPTNFFEDCLGNTHVMAKDSMYQLANTHGNVFIYERNSKKIYDQFLKHCAGKTEESVLLSHLSNYNKTLSYYHVAQPSQERSLLYRIEDSVAVEDIYNERQIIRMEGYDHEHRMQEISLKQLLEMRDKQERKDYFTIILTTPEYHPLFVQSDTTYIFDHLNNQVATFSSTGDTLDTQSIDYHQQEQWEKQIHRDPSRGRFYTVASKNGIHHLQRLSSSFKIDRESTITKHVNPKKVMIYNGFAYYTYRPNQDAHLNKLYRQKL